LQSHAIQDRANGSDAEIENVRQLFVTEPTDLAEQEGVTLAIGQLSERRANAEPLGLEGRPDRLGNDIRAFGRVKWRRA
jgi:hypothetical protein